MTATPANENDLETPKAGLETYENICETRASLT